MVLRVEYFLDFRVDKVLVGKVSGKNLSEKDKEVGKEGIGKVHKV